MIITINSNNAHTVQSLLYKVHMNEPRTEDEFYGWVCLVESSYYNAITPLTGQITTSWASDWLTWAWPWVSVWAMRGQGWGRPITVLRERERGESSVCRRHDTQHAGSWWNNAHSGDWVMLGDMSLIVNYLFTLLCRIYEYLFNIPNILHVRCWSNNNMRVQSGTR